MNSTSISATTEGAFVTALLVPSTALACGGPHMGAYAVTALIGMLALTAAAYAFVTAGTVRFVEKVRGFELDRPDWWKTRLWTVGMLGWVGAAAILVAVNAIGLDAMHLIPEEIYAAFLFTLPLVAQFGAVAWTWHRRGAVGLQSPAPSAGEPDRQPNLLDVTTFVGTGLAICAATIPIAMILAAQAESGEAVVTLVLLGLVLIIAPGGFAMISAGLTRLVSLLLPVEFDRPSSWEFRIWLVGVAAAFIGLLLGAELYDHPLEHMRTALLVSAGLEWLYIVVSSIRRAHTAGD